MKRLISLLSFIMVITFCSCSSAKILTISSEGVPFKDNHFVFENDTVKITYHFWADKGIMNFDIFNKMDAPIYFDWKNCAFIPNDQMVSYWQDVTNTTGTSSASSSWFYGGVLTASNGQSKSVHQERVGVIPPHAMIKRKDFKLVKYSSDVAKAGSYTKDNSFLNFRNYLMFSTNEQFQGKTSVIDNTFYISNIKVIKWSKVDEFKSQDCFYSKILRYEEIRNN